MFHNGWAVAQRQGQIRTPSIAVNLTPIPVFPESLRDRTWARYFVLDLIAIFTDRKMEPFDLLQSFLSRA
jgi:hypothetical protein